MKPLPRVIVEDKLFIAFSLVHSYETGKVARPVRLTPQNEWGFSIGRNSKFTDLTDLTNVDGRMDGRTDGWTPFSFFQDPPLHTTTVTSKVITSNTF